MKKRANQPGAFLRIRLADGSFAYARELEHPYLAFYNYRSKTPEVDLNVIANKPVLFSVAVRRRDDSWETLGTMPLVGEVSKPIVQFTQDIADPSQCTIFDTAGMERDATPEECVGLERASVWESHGIEERLLDTFLVRPNEEEVRSRVRLR